MREILKYRHCFVCGDENPGGLKAKFFFDGKEAITELTADESFEGYRGIYHGGVLSSLLDEVMIKALLAQDIYAVTAEMTIKFKRPVRTGDKLKLVGRHVGGRGRVYFTEGEAVDENGQVYATATGKYIEARADLRDDLKNSID